MKNPTIIYLDQIRHNLNYADFDLIYRSISDLRGKCLPTALIEKNANIDRIRINKPGEVFTSIDEINYIKDPNILKNHVKYGRANIAGQGVFYGSIISHQIQDSMLVAYIETSELVKMNKSIDFEEDFTLGRWRVKEKIEVADMIYNEEPLKVNQYSQEALAMQKPKYENLTIAEHCEEQLKFFSDEFARNDILKGEDYSYKISSAYANYLWKNTPFRGVTYPSVATKYFGQNIALLPELVDRFLNLEKVVQCKFIRKNGVDTFVAVNSTTDLGPNSMNFKW